MPTIRRIADVADRLTVLHRGLRPLWFVHVGSTPLPNPGFSLDDVRLSVGARSIETRLASRDAA